MNYNKIKTVLLCTVNLCIALLISLADSSSAQKIERPPITRIAHISFKVSDIGKARNFYGKFLGFNEAFSFNDKDGKFALTNFKVNDRQYIEITPTLLPNQPDRLNHICFETTDIEKMREYLAQKGVKVPDKLNLGRDKNYHFMVTDPDGHLVEFVQIQPGSSHAEAKGKYLAGKRISDRISHAGITVKNEKEADKFYRSILNFPEIWRGGINDSVTSYVNLGLPESTDYIEYMMVDDSVSANRLHSAHHAGLMVPDLQKAIDFLRDKQEDWKMDNPKIGRNRRWLLNMYDADGTRIELMEPHTVK
jgi:catechol 2,3-dioxygenase-like lactoylglutathione lyase family enzyme